jgi:hypothetical protein
VRNMVAEFCRRAPPSDFPTESYEFLMSYACYIPVYYIVVSSFTKRVRKSLYLMLNLLFGCWHRVEAKGGILREAKDDPWSVKPLPPKKRIAGTGG